MFLVGTFSVCPLEHMRRESQASPHTWAEHRLLSCKKKKKTILLMHKSLPLRMFPIVYVFHFLIMFLIALRNKGKLLPL